MSQGKNFRLPNTAKPALLYIDDEPSNISVVELRLEEHYQIYSAANDREACALLREHLHELTIVLMDVQLIGSQLDGVELSKLIRGTLPRSTLPDYATGITATKHLPILFVTAFGEKYDLSGLTAAGADGVLAKPLDFVKLSSAITRHYLKGMLRH